MKNQDRRTNAFNIFPPRDQLAAAALAYDRKRPTRARKVDSALALELWRAGASDPEIAGACGVVRRAAKAWRDARQLPPNREQGGVGGIRKLNPEAKLDLLRRLGAGERIAPIARDFGISHTDVAWHRQRAGLGAKRT